MIDDQQEEHPSYLLYAADDEDDDNDRVVICHGVVEQEQKKETSVHWAKNVASDYTDERNCNHDYWLNENEIRENEGDKDYFHDDDDDDDGEEETDRTESASCSFDILSPQSIAIRKNARRLLQLMSPSPSSCSPMQDASSSGSSSSMQLLSLPQRQQQRQRVILDPPQEGEEQSSNRPSQPQNTWHPPPPAENSIYKRKYYDCHSQKTFRQQERMALSRLDVNNIHQKQPPLSPPQRRQRQLLDKDIPMYDIIHNNECTNRFCQKENMDVPNSNKNILMDNKKNNHDYRDSGSRKDNDDILHFNNDTELLPLRLVDQITTEMESDIREIKEGFTNIASMAMTASGSIFTKTWNVWNDFLTDE